MVVVNTYSFADHLSKLVFPDINAAAFHMVNYECCGCDSSWTFEVVECKRNKNNILYYR